MDSAKYRFSISGIGISCLLVVATVAADEPPRRLLPCPIESRQAVQQWQTRTRITLFALMKIDDLVARNRGQEEQAVSMPLNAETLETQDRDQYVESLLEIDAYPGRRIKVVVTVPHDATPQQTPAVICIHGHGGNRNVVYDPSTVYHGFARVLAEQGYVTLSTDVGQHEVQDAHRTLMGERLWDVMRTVDLATSLPEVAADRIGCAGLSLGGEMAMWLGAMDTRIAATVSSGFLTTMENLRQGHCMCWDFPGLQRRYEFSDIYSLISPRALQCQNGRQEQLPGGFPVELAKQAWQDIHAVYAAQRHSQAASLAVHPGGHEFDVMAAKKFLDATLIERD